MQVDATNADVQLQLGVLFCKRARWREAIEPLRAAVASDPGRVAAHYYLGEAYNHIDDLPAALSAYEVAATLDPKNSARAQGDRRRARPHAATRRGGARVPARARGAARVIEVRVEDLAFYSGERRDPAGHRDARRHHAAAATVRAGRRRTRCSASSRSADPLPVGSAVVTGAGELPVELLVHAIVTQPHGARHARRRAARLPQRAGARRANGGSATWPVAPMGLGAGNLEIEESAELMADELRAHRRGSAVPAARDLRGRDARTRRERWSTPWRGATA